MVLIAPMFLFVMFHSSQACKAKAKKISSIILSDESILNSNIVEHPHNVKSYA